MSADELRARLGQCQADREKSRYSALVTALPELLNHGFAILAQARPGTETETAWALLDDTYELTHTACIGFGYYDLGALAARFGRDAAAKAGDPLRAAADTCRYLGVQFHRGDHTGVLRAANRGHALLDGARSPVAQAVRVVLHLRQSAVYAQRGALDRSDELLDEARRLVASGVPPSPSTACTRPRPISTFIMSVHPCRFPMESRRSFGPNKCNQTGPRRPPGSA